MPMPPAPPAPSDRTVDRTVDRTAERTAKFSRHVTISAIGKKALTLEIEADAATRRILAGRLGLVELVSLRAELALKRVRGGRQLRLSGRLWAEVVQTCVATLEPVGSVLDETFEAYFLIPGQEADEAEGGIDEEAEPLTSESLDVGEAVAAELALVIDPYPRKPGVSLDLGPDGAKKWALEEPAEDGRAVRHKPFEGLAALRGNK